LTKKKKRLHKEVGRAIEEIYSERLEEFYEMLAYHYSQSDSLEKTYEYLKVSGKKAVKSNSLKEAYLYYKEALNALNQLPLTDDNKRKQVEIIHLMFAPLKYIGIPKDTLETIERGMKFARELGDEQSRAILKLFQNSFRTWGPR
jgi:predicted ATPase